MVDLALQFVSLVLPSRAAAMSAAASDTNKKKKEMEEAKQKQRQRSASAPGQGTAGASSSGPGPPAGTTGTGGFGGIFRIHTPPRTPSKRGADAGPGAGRHPQGSGNGTHPLADAHPSPGLQLHPFCWACMGGY